MDYEIFRKLGLTGNEITVYFALLELGTVTAGDIIKKTHLSRGQVYDCMDSLAEKGVVSFNIQANTKYFEAISPKSFKLIVEQRKEEIASIENNLVAMLPILEAKRKLGKEPQEVTLFKGKRGMKSLLYDSLEEKQDVYIIGGFTEEAETLKYFMKYVFPAYMDKRIKLKIKSTYIFPEGSIFRAKQLLEYPYTEVRILPAKFASISATQIRGDKVDIMLWSSDPIGIMIRSKEIASYQKKYFDFLWSMAKPLK
jgi:sugar-specific transcriptional regulator TrmB